MIIEMFGCQENATKRKVNGKYAGKLVSLCFGSPEKHRSSLNPAQYDSVVFCLAACQWVLGNGVFGSWRIGFREVDCFSFTSGLILEFSLHRMLT